MNFLKVSTVLMGIVFSGAVLAQSAPPQLNLPTNPAGVKPVAPGPATGPLKGLESAEWKKEHPAAGQEVKADGVNKEKGGKAAHNKGHVAKPDVKKPVAK